jgi:hypothetical protein
MRNISLLYMPPGNVEAMVHSQDTIRNKVAFDRIAPHISSTTARKLQQVFGPRRIAVWESRDTDANRSKFDRLKEGDEILIVEGQTIKIARPCCGKRYEPESIEKTLEKFAWRLKRRMGSHLFHCQCERDRAAVQHILQTRGMAGGFPAARLHEGRA